MPKCFVPGCENTVGVLFPKNAEVKKRWLNSLELVSIEPESNSFVCLDHFEDDSEGKIGALPTRKPPKEPPSMKEISNIVVSQVKTDEQSTIKVKNDPEMKESNDNQCRLCLKVSENWTNINDKIDEKYTVSDAISICLFPVFGKQGLSEKICSACLSKLTDFLQFKQVCVKNDKEQKSSSGMMINEFEEFSDDMLDDSSDDEYFTETFGNEVPKNNKRKNGEQSEETPKSKVARKQSSGNVKSEVDERFDKVEEELLKVLEGNSSENTANHDISTIEQNDEDQTDECEEIILEVVNEEDTQGYKLTSTTLPIIIKPVSNTTNKKSPNSTEKKDNKLKAVKTSKSDVVMLPSSIKVEVKHQYKSPLGTFGCIMKPYVLDNEFVLAEGYIYGHRLMKGHIRLLHCLYPKCPAEATQSKLVSSSESNYEDEITVLKCHNHKPDDANGRKRQMFFQVMRKQIQDNKDLNFKNLYDRICRLDTSIRDLVPLKTVINQLCRYGSTNNFPKIKSFKQLYEQIEDACFSKIHYTFCGPQFYQERFMDEKNDAMAIVFANTEIIQKYSYSKLLYVDASFQVLPDLFPYKMVTVLVWVHDNCYPILFAFINKETQDIYKKIFGFLYNDLASDLRPDEIVTSFESSLYYALAETYVDSHIGGAIFYYAQNLYKKICSLNLAKELETNSSFRNIYHMLLMLPLLPVNTIMDGLRNIEQSAEDMILNPKTFKLFDHVRSEWISKVTPEFFCVHNLENRINENIIAPFKKLRDLFMIHKNKYTKYHSPILQVIQKVIDLEVFLRTAYSNSSKRSFARDLTSTQKKTVLRAWNYIDNHPKININYFFSKVTGYIRLMENQVWIWGFYQYQDPLDEELIDATNFVIETNDLVEEDVVTHESNVELDESDYECAKSTNPNQKTKTNQDQPIVMEAVFDKNGQVILQKASTKNSSVDNLENV
ncbi:uncharacterized protein LOC132699933 [Cylas formicarius]|uniref:uncharacterized protein LOC132699933 n=1 Tax=Cylas formicarius TaxID=197179 RepID=UPI002958CD2A|nr:uncharacterized protein LOC132699933 [Cylas formicarius]